MKRIVLPILLSSLIGGSVVYGTVWPGQLPAADVPNGYLESAEFGNGFLAVGSDGRIDSIQTDGTVKTLQDVGDAALLDIGVAGDTALIVGDGGTAVSVTSNRTVQERDLGTQETLYSVCSRDGQWLVGSEEGTVYTGQGLQSWSRQSTGAKGAVVGLAAAKGRCIGVTDQGEVVVSTDGVSWNVLDYKAYYGDAVSFRGITTVDNVFWAFGQREDGSSMVVTSMEGGVWTNRDLNIYDLNTVTDASDACFYDVNSDGTQAYAVTDRGEVLVMPGCTSCNTLRSIGDWPIYTTARSGETLLFAGSEFQVSVQSIYSIRQGSIKAEAARDLQRSGAVMIDVRSAEEYEKAHIPGSIHMDAADVATALPQQYPQRDQTIIFYCASGKRSQTALETAQSLGYGNVYNLGGISNWPYGLEP